jgi:FPC/CPF motif-containing protein YcgG
MYASLARSGKMKFHNQKVLVWNRLVQNWIATQTFLAHSEIYFGVIIIGRVYCFSSRGSLVIVTTHPAKSTLRERGAFMAYAVLFQCSG